MSNELHRLAVTFLEEKGHKISLAASADSAGKAAIVIDGNRYDPDVITWIAAEWYADEWKAAEQKFNNRLKES